MRCACPASAAADVDSARAAAAALPAATNIAMLRARRKVS
jgi:hypothetical protein